MKRSVLIGSLLLFSVLLSTCKKDEVECPCQYEQGFEMVKDWMYFKTGSYWIYQEENSGAIDTLTVWEDWEGIAQEVNDAFYTYTVSSYDGFYYLYHYNSSFSTQCLTLKACQCEKVSRAKGKPGNFVGEERNLFFPPILSNYTYPVEGISVVTLIIDQYPITSSLYAHTAVYEVEQDSSEDGQNTIYYVSKNVGVVRKELLATKQVWNLIEYDVIQ